MTDAAKFKIGQSVVMLPYDGEIGVVRECQWREGEGWTYGVLREQQGYGVRMREDELAPADEAPLEPKDEPAEPQPREPVDAARREDVARRLGEALLSSEDFGYVEIVRHSRGDDGRLTLDGGLNLDGALLDDLDDLL